MDDACEALNDPQFWATVRRSDGLIIVAPEHNHSFPGPLNMCSTRLSGIRSQVSRPRGVSAGPFGGARMIPSLVPVLRELGLVTIFWDVNFSDAGQLFDETEKITDPAYSRRVEKFLRDLV